MINTVSVCMATYNGETYLRNQLESILLQLRPLDELIIVDDFSTDKTIEIINSINDLRIKLFVNNINMGVNKSFEKAISLSKNNYIFLSDQDDYWPKNRLNKMLDALISNNALVLYGNSTYIDAKDRVIKFPIKNLVAEDSHKNFKNIIKIFFGSIGYYGCASLINKKIIPLIYPFPSFLESHDLWIAMVGNMLNKIIHQDETILIRRIHNNNASLIKRPIFKIIFSRFLFLKMFFIARKRIKFMKSQL